MKIQSKAFEQDQAIPAKYTCDGDGVNPPLLITGLPAEAKALALIVDDPDAPIGTFVHWTLWNVPVSADGTVSIAENSVPSGAVQGVTGARKPGYIGPCPPSGTHHYFFKVYALDAVLGTPATADADTLESQMASHILDKAGLIGLYSRNKL